MQPSGKIFLWNTLAWGERFLNYVLCSTFFYIFKILSMSFPLWAACFKYTLIYLTKKLKCFQIFIIFGTCCFTAFCVRGISNLRQQFDPKWFLPSDSYLVQYLDAKDKWYADSGQDASILLGRLNYSTELTNIHWLVKELRRQEDVVKDVNTWYEGFRIYLNTHFNRGITTNCQLV